MKKMKNKILMSLSIVVISATLFSCGRVPQSKIDATNAAIETAKTAEAPVYLTTEFNAVQDSMTSIMSAVESQKSKVFKRFGDIKVKLDTTTAVATRLASKAVVKKAEVKAEVETSLTEVKNLNDENMNLVKKAPKGKDGRVVLAQINTDIVNNVNAVTEAQSMYDNGSYMDAKNKLDAVKKCATDINTELKDAISKVRR